jgi:hypothetical protein
MGSGFARLCCVLTVAALGACTPEPETPDPGDLLVARQAALGFDVRYRMEILDRLERDEDPVAVYMSYRDHVPGYAKDISERLGLEFSRVSARPRNPLNSADDWEREQLAQFEFWRETGRDPSVMESAAIVEEDGRKLFRWMRPLVADEPCMACHGDEVDPRLLKLLAQEYPLDEATGYYDTEIIGAYSVTKVLEEE